MPGAAGPPLNGDAQISVMQREVAELIANGQPLTLFGDNLFVEIDLSVRSLPPGSRVRIGTAILEVTPKAHNGCRKFAPDSGRTRCSSLRSRSCGIETCAEFTCAS